MLADAVNFEVAPGEAIPGSFRPSPEADHYAFIPAPRAALTDEETAIVRFDIADLVMTSAGEVISVNCRHETASRRRANLPALRPQQGRLLAHASAGAVAEHDVEVADAGSTVSYWDERTGWVMVVRGGFERSRADRYTEFASGIAAALERGRLVALWLRMPRAGSAAQDQRAEGAPHRARSPVLLRGDTDRLLATA
jgi:hypothetical protein